MPVSFLKRVAYNCNGFIRGLCLGQAKMPCKISPFAVFKGKIRNIYIGNYTVVYSKAYLECDASGYIRVGAHCEIHGYARLSTYGGNIEVGDYCSVNPYSILYGHGGLEIGNMVRIAAHVVIIPGSHGTERIDIPIMNQSIENKKILIMDDVWIGAGAKILGGVTINSGAVVGANAVVANDVPENAIVVGVPAKVLKYRDEKSH